MGVPRVRGIALPGGEVVNLYADGEHWTTDPVPNAELVGEGWLVPGLVDVHTHPGARLPGDTLDHELLRSDLRDHLLAGVTLVRSPGLAGDPPNWFGSDALLPRAVHAGPWIAQPNQFFDGWGQRATPAEIPLVAAEQAGRSGWAKLIGDWKADDPALSVDVLRAAVATTHAAGGRLAVHAQTAAGSAAAARAGVDSIEHGQGLDADLLPFLAANGTALTPTLGVITNSLTRLLAAGESPSSSTYVETASVHAALVLAAAEEGVTILAGTDARPHGRVADEIRALAEAGLSAHQALGAGSWSARDYLGLAGLVDGAPADAVVFTDDPRDNLDGLNHPAAIVLRGSVITSRL